jgi:hypothetical protein
MNQQLLRHSHSLIGAYKDKAQTEFFGWDNRKASKGMAEQDSDVTLGRIGSRIGLPWLLKWSST